MLMSYCCNETEPKTDHSLANCVDIAVAMSYQPLEQLILVYELELGVPF